MVFNLVNVVETESQGWFALEEPVLVKHIGDGEVWEVAHLIGNGVNGRFGSGVVINVLQFFFRHERRVPSVHVVHIHLDDCSVV